MINYPSFEGKIIRMNEPYPITNENDEILGYTKTGDIAVITLADKDYFETVIVSGKFIGINSLALNLSDIMKSTFVFNSINYNDEVMIQNKKVKYEYIDTSHQKNDMNNQEKECENDDQNEFEY